MRNLTEKWYSGADSAEFHKRRNKYRYQFKKVCKYFRFEDEYPGWTGDEKYGIMTDLSEDELLEEFPVIMKVLSPYIILNKDYENVRRESISFESGLE